MTTDERLHFLGGWFKGLPWRWASYHARLARVYEVDRWAWAREVAQHDPDLTPHQIREAAAWGAGTRAAVRLPAAPWAPPYPAWPLA